MRKLWLRSLALSLGLVATGAQAQEVAWKSSAPSQPGKPIAVATSRPAQPEAPASVAVSSAPVATLGRPQVIARSSIRDENVQPASFAPKRDPLAPVIRGSSPEVGSSRPLPPGPSIEMTAMPTPGYSYWKRADGVMASAASRNGTETAAPPTLGNSSILIAPTPSSAPMNAPGFGLAPNVVASTPGNAFPAPTVISGPGLNGPISSMPCGNDGCKPMAQAVWGGGAINNGEPRFTLGFESLFWWITDDKSPALVNSAPVGTPLAATAFTSVLVGGSNNPFAADGFVGMRLRATYWFSDDHLWGVDGSAFLLPEQQDNIYLQSTGTPVQIGRPFVDFAPTIIVPGPVVNGVPTTRVVANPNFGGPASEIIAGTEGGRTAVGDVSIMHRTSLWGFDANLRRNLWLGDMMTSDVFFGYRQLGLDESLTITERVLTTQNQAGGVPIAGTVSTIRDQFSVTSRFYGGQIGLDNQFRFGDFSIGIRGSIALGCTQQTLDITGSRTTVVPPNTTVVTQGGLLALQGTNIGGRSRNMFSVVPEVGLTVGYDLYDWLRVSAGYNFLYWNNVVRAGEQVDPRVNVNFLPDADPRLRNTGQRVPAQLFPNSDFFAHGVTFGLELRY